MGKDIAYIHLYDSMKDDCCPVCKLVNDRIIQMMEAFLYEGVNDTSNRKRITESRGFCNYHSRMLMDMGDPLAHAMIYSGLISLVIKDIKREEFSKYENHANCIFCEETAKCEDSYISVLSEGFYDEEFTEQYIKGGMLCVRHMKMLLQKDRSAFRKAEKITLQKYERLIEYLEEIIRKNDYRFSSEEWSSGARESWRRAVDVINSRCI